MLSRFVEFAEAVLPLAARGTRNRTHRSGFVVDVLQRESDFTVVRLSAQHFSIEALDALRRLYFARDIRASRELAGLLDPERAVHHVQRLLRHRSHKSFPARRIGACVVERAEQTWKILSVDKPVHRAPRNNWI